MEIQAQKRGLLKKGVKKLREEGLLPAVISGKDFGSIPLTLNQKEFEKLYREAGESTLVDVIIDNEKPQKALISEVARDPVSDKIIHANFHAVKMTEKVSAMVPVKLVGESPIVKSGAGILLTILDEIEVEALPQDLPGEIEVDISGLTAIDQGITVADLRADRQKLTIKNEPEEMIVKIEHPQMEETEEEAAEETPPEQAVEITKEKPQEESEAELPKQSEDKKNS